MELAPFMFVCSIIYGDRVAEAFREAIPENACFHLVDLSPGKGVKIFLIFFKKVLDRVGAYGMLVIV